MSDGRAFRLQLFGSPAIVLPDGAVLAGPAAQRHRLALLAFLALPHGRGWTRDTLKAHLWPESDTRQARQLLNQAVHQIRKALGESALVSALDNLVLNADVIGSDVAHFEAACAQGDLRAAVTWYKGPFLDGFFLPGAPEFDAWAEGERMRLGHAYGKALDQLAEEAEAAHDAALAAEWWSARAAHDPYDSRVALRLVEALEAAGNRAGALRHAALHHSLLSEGFGAGPDPDVLALAERLRINPSSWSPRSGGESRSPSATIVVPPNARPIPGGWRWSVPAVAAMLLLAAALFAISRSGPGIDVLPPMALPQGTGNIAAYDLYRRGMDPVLLRGDSSAEAGLGYVREAVSLDPNFAAGWAGVGRMYGRVASGAPSDQRLDFLRLAHRATATAVALDEGVAEGHATFALLHLRSFDPAAARRHLDRAMELDPTLALANELLVLLHLWEGRTDLALEQAGRAVDLDPLSAIAYANLAAALLHNDRCDKALPHLSRLLRMQPPLLRAAPLTALCLARNHRWTEAIAALRPQADAGEPHAQALLGYTLGRAGHTGEARRLRAHLIERAEGGDPINAFQVAAVDVGIGDYDSAFARIDAEVAGERSEGVPGLTINVIIMGLLVEELQGDPRFESVRAALGLRLR